MSGASGRAARSGGDTQVGRRARLGLIALSAFVAVQQSVVLVSALRANPYTAAPVLDARHYWDWAGRIAGGELVAETPFHSAPLYPYLLGLLRALGGGLLAAGALNGLLFVGAVCLVAIAGRRLFGATVGLLGGALLALSSEPALETPQTLAGPLQVFLAAAILERCSALSAGPTQARVLAVAALSGLATLAWPAMLLAVPVFIAFTARCAGRRAALLHAVAAVAVIAPATLHNWLAAEELIPVSAHGGITFWHGNNPEARGTLHIVGVENDKDTYHLDALRQTRAARGPEAGWRATSEHFFARGLAWWRAEPLRALEVFGLKVWYTVSGRVYSDVHPLALERADGLVPAAWLAPVPVAWFAPLGLIAAALLALRRGRACVPLALVVCVPVAVCAVFWYTPRYRVPAAPGLALAAVAVLHGAVGAAAPLRRRLAFVLLGAFGPLTGPLNRWVGFDPPGAIQRVHRERTAAAFGSLGRHREALALLQKALAAEPEDAALRRRVFTLMRALGDERGAVALLEAAPSAVAREAGYRLFLAWSLATSPEPAARDGERALALAQAALNEPAAQRDPVAHDVLAAALAELQRFPAALEALDRAASWSPAGDPLRSALAARREQYRRGLPWRDPAPTLTEPSEADR